MGMADHRQTTAIIVEVSNSFGAFRTHATSISFQNTYPCTPSYLGRFLHQNRGSCDRFPWFCLSCSARFVDAGTTRQVNEGLAKSTDLKGLAKSNDLVEMSLGEERSLCGWSLRCRNARF